MLTVLTTSASKGHLVVRVAFACAGRRVEPQQKELTLDDLDCGEIRGEVC